jgi:hypothetical protein
VAVPGPTVTPQEYASAQRRRGSPASQPGSSRLIEVQLQLRRRRMITPAADRFGVIPGSYLVRGIVGPSIDSTNHVHGCGVALDLCAMRDGYRPLAGLPPGLRVAALQLPEPGVRWN